MFDLFVITYNSWINSVNSRCTGFGYVATNRHRRNILQQKVIKAISEHRVFKFKAQAVAFEPLHANQLSKNPEVLTQNSRKFLTTLDAIVAFTLIVRQYFTLNTTRIS